MSEYHHILTMLSRTHKTILLHSASNACDYVDSVHNVHRHQNLITTHPNLSQISNYFLLKHSQPVKPNVNM